MKKSLVLVLALVFVLSLSSAAFAAANPFVDVPAKHWAYDAVSQLAKAGIVDGYGDGTFRGDKTMTRYEMAQIVAKAMAKSDKADAATKATIDKLAVEFAAELNNLGVRVTKLEQNQQNIKFTGAFAMRYSVTDYTDDSARANTANAQYRLRMDGVAKVDDKTTFGMRFVTREPDKANIGNDTWQEFGNSDQNTASAVNIDRAYIATKIGTVATTIGRQSLFVDSQNIVMDSGAFSYDGAKFVVPAGKVNVTANYGRFLKAATMQGKDYNSKTDVLFTGNVDLASLALNSTAGKLAWNLGYYDFRASNVTKLWDGVATQTVTGMDDFDVMKLTLFNGIYNFDSKLSLNAMYGKNSADKIAPAYGDYFWAAKVVYGDQVLNKAGANNVSVQYLDKKANAFVNNFSGLDASSGNYYADRVDFTSLNLQYNYAFSKNFNATLSWTKIDPSFKGAEPTNKDSARTVSRIICNVLF